MNLLKLFNIACIFLLMSFTALADIYWTGPTSAGANDGTSRANRWAYTAVPWTTLEAGGVDTLYVITGNDTTTYSSTWIIRHIGEADSTYILPEPDSTGIAKFAPATGHVIQLGNESAARCSTIVIDGTTARRFYLTDGTGHGIHFRYDNNGGARLSYLDFYDGSPGGTANEHAIMLRSSDGVYINNCNLVRWSGDAINGSGASNNPTLKTNITIRDCYIENNDDGIQWNSGLTVTGTTFRRGSVTPAGAHPDGIQGVVGHMTIANNIFINQGQAVFFETTADSMGYLDVYNNIFFRRTGETSTASHTILKTKSGGVPVFVDSVRWYNNTYAHFGTAGANYRFQATQGDTVTFGVYQFYNNIFHNRGVTMADAVAPSYITQDTATTKFKNNLGTSSASISFAGVGYANFDAFDAGTGFNNYVGQTFFVDTSLASYNFNLRPPSAARDIGRTETLVSPDYGGTARPKGAAYDAGAYEFDPRSGDITTGLEAHYKFEEGSGTTVYDSVGNYNGVMSGAAYSKSIFGDYSMKFDGTGNVIMQEHDFGVNASQEFTLSYWIYDSLTATGEHVKNNGFIYPYFAYELSSARVQCGIRNTGSGVQYLTIDGVTLNKAHHIVFTFGSNKFRGYVDGVIEDSLTTSGTLFTDFANVLTVGNNWAGRMDELRIYSRRLTHGDVAALYDAKEVTYNTPDTLYIAQEAVGTGTGYDWTNAFTSIPQGLGRGKVYYIADGSYGSYTFDDPEESSQWITIKRATVADHGTSTGWNTSLIDDTTKTNNLFFSTGRYHLDGAVGGGPGIWHTGYKWSISPNSSAQSSRNIMFTGGAHNYIFRNLELHGYNRDRNSGGGSAVYNFVQTSNVVFDSCSFVDIPLVMFHTGAMNNWTISNNNIARNGPAGTPTHREAWSGAGNNLNHQLFNNKWEDISNTGIIEFVNGIGRVKMNVYNNIFMNTDTVSAVSISNAIGAKWHAPSNTFMWFDSTNIYNNVFYNLNGLGAQVAVDSARATRYYNNIIAYDTVNTIFHGVQVDADSNLYIGNYRPGVGNLNGVDPGDINATTDPFVNRANFDLRLKELSQAINAGTPYFSLAKDILNVDRGYIPDMGPYEFAADIANDSIWYVDPSATGTGDGKSWANAFSGDSALYKAEAALTAADTIWIFCRSLGGAADSTAVHFDGTGANNYSASYVYLIGENQNATTRGVWDTGIYRLYINTDDYCIRANYILHVKNMQVSNNINSAAFANYLWFGPGNGTFILENCLARQEGTKGIGYQAFGSLITSPSTVTFKVINSVVLNNTDKGITISDGGTGSNITMNGSFYNCTVNGDGTNLGYEIEKQNALSTMTVNVINCIADSNGTDFILSGAGSPAWGGSTSNNLSTDATAPGTSSLTDTTATFVDRDNFDFRLAGGSAGIDDGATIASNPTSFDEDIARPQGPAYDMGAFEFFGILTVYVDPDAVGAATGVDSANAFTSLADAEASLYFATEINIICFSSGGTADSTVAVFDGFGIEDYSVNNVVRVIGQNKSAATPGVWDDNIYRMVRFSAGPAAANIATFNTHIIFEDLQFSIQQTGFGEGYNINNSQINNSLVEIYGCIFRATAASTQDVWGYYLWSIPGTSNANCKIANNVFYGFKNPSGGTFSSAINITAFGNGNSTTSWIYNNTIYDCEYGITGETGGTGTNVIYARNNIVNNSSVGDYVTKTGAATTWNGDFNMDEDNSAPGASSITATATFRDGPAYDLRIREASRGFNEGTNLSSDPDLPVTEDFRGIGRPRFGVFDMGAFEADTVYYFRHVRLNKWWNDPVTPADDDTLQLYTLASNGSKLDSAFVRILPKYISSGDTSGRSYWKSTTADSIRLQFQIGYDSTLYWTSTTGDTIGHGVNPFTFSATAFPVHRYYYVDPDVAGGDNSGSSWANAFPSLQTFADSTEPADSITVYCRSSAGSWDAGNGVKNRIKINGINNVGFYLDANMTIEGQNDSAARVGQWDDSIYRISCASNPDTASGSDGSLDLRVRNLTLRKIQIEKRATSQPGNGVLLNPPGENNATHQYIIEKVIIRNNPTTQSFGINGIRNVGTLTKLNLSNSLIYNLGSGAFGGFFGGGTEDVFISNCTFYNMYWAIIRSSHTKLIFRNCIAQNVVDGYFTASTFNASSDYNMSDLAGDAPGSHSLNSTTALFEGAASGDFRLRRDSDGVDDGIVIVGGSFPITQTINNINRPVGSAWDMGAFDTYVPPIANSITRSQHKSWAKWPKR